MVKDKVNIASKNDMPDSVLFPEPLVTISHLEYGQRCSDNNFIHETGFENVACIFVPKTLGPRGLSFNGHN